MKATALYARPAPDFADRLQRSCAVLRQGSANWSPRIALACSLGAEDMVLVHLIGQLRLDIGIFVLDTGQLHTQTLELLARLQANSRANVTVYRPNEHAVLQFVRREGPEAMFRSVDLRKACCALRKLEPLQRALADLDAWISGLRREQSGARADVELVQESAGRTKINPLAHWSWGDVWHYIATEQIDYNPLHDAFYPSIGCAPCTRAIAAGEDQRAGRWWWEQDSAKECGLHVSNAATTPGDQA